MKVFINIIIEFNGIEIIIHQMIFNYFKILLTLRINSYYSDILYYQSLQSHLLFISMIRCLLFVHHYGTNASVIGSALMLL